MLTPTTYNVNYRHRRNILIRTVVLTMPKLKSCLAFGFKTMPVAGIAVDAFQLGREIHAAYHMLEDAAELADALDSPENPDSGNADGEIPGTRLPADILPSAGAAEALRVIRFAEGTVNPELVIKSCVTALNTHLASRDSAQA